MSKFMKNLFILILFFFISTNSHLIIPLKYYPLYKYNNTNPSEIMKSIVASKLYAKIDIGTPIQQIEIPLLFNSHEFFISNKPKFEDDNLFSDLKFYLNNESNSWKSSEEYAYYAENFDFAELGKESFSFNDTRYELDFYFSISVNYQESGGIGLIFPRKPDIQTDPEKIFFKQLKDKKLIKNYVWSIFFSKRDIEKEAEGFILFGSLPNELNIPLGYYDKKYFQNEIKNINIEKYITDDVNIFKIDKITVYEGNNKKIIINDFPIDDPSMQLIQLNYHSNGIQAPFILYDKFKTIFLNNSNGECFMDEFKYSSKKYFFYCNNKEEVINKIKSIFPGFIFLSRDLNFNFTINADDLFLKKDSYVFCLLYFNYDSYLYKYWAMGKPFLRKYQFSINPDNNLIHFYLEKEEQDSGGKINVSVLIFSIIATIIIVAVICFLLFKFYLYDIFLRKKRANELDDDFDYIEKKGEDSDNLNQQNNKNINIEIN